MRWSILAAIAVVCATVVGCDSSSDGGRQLSPEEVTALENQLRAKPPFEVAQRQYRDAATQMANQIAALVPGTTWTFTQDTWMTCAGDYVRTRGKEAYFMVQFSSPIPDDKWGQAVEIVKNATTQFGATDFGVMKDKPTDHDVYFSGPNGVEFKLGTQKAAVLTAKADCRISQADTTAQSSTPAP